MIFVSYSSTSNTNCRTEIHNGNFGYTSLSSKCIRLRSSMETGLASRCTHRITNFHLLHRGLGLNRLPADKKCEWKSTLSFIIREKQAKSLKTSVIGG